MTDRFFWLICLAFNAVALGGVAQAVCRGVP